MATKLKRGKVWRYVIKRKVLLPKPIYLTFEDEEEGDMYVARLEKLLDNGIVPQEFKENEKAITTLRHAIDAYISAVHVAAVDVELLGVTRGRIENIGLDKVTYPWAEKWIAGMKSDGKAPSTIRHHVGALARCLDWLVNQGTTMLVANPLRMLPKRYATSESRKDVERDRRRRWGEEEAIRKILAGEKPKNRERALTLQHRDSLVLFFDLALETGMRMREMFTLNCEQIDLRAQTIFLEKTKNGDNRQVPMSSVVTRLLVDTRKTGRLFPWWDGDSSRVSLERTTSLLSRQFARIFAAAGCEDLHFHDLRHEATSRIFERTTLDAVSISRITGHKDPRMLRRYSNLRGSDLARKLW